MSINRNADIDYTEDLEIGSGVSIAEGEKVLTHGHNFFGLKDKSEIILKTNGAFLTKLIIEDNVFIIRNSARTRRRADYSQSF